MICAIFIPPLVVVSTSRGIGAGTLKLAFLKAPLVGSSVSQHQSSLPMICAIFIPPLVVVSFCVVDYFLWVYHDVVVLERFWWFQEFQYNESYWLLHNDI